MRTLTANTAAKAAQDLGTKPIIIVKIDWPSGAVYYADKTLTLGTINALGSLLECNAIYTNQTSDSKGEISGVNIKLSDTTGLLKQIWNTDIIENTPITVYHHYEGLTQSDLLIVFKGKVINPIVWDEGTRTLTIDGESVIDSQDAGYAPAEGAFANLSPNAVDKAWPMCFGTVLHVPCVKIKDRPKGTLRFGINNNMTEYYIDGGADFPQDTPVSIKIRDIKFTGTFSGDKFTVTSFNDAINSNVALADRPTNDPDYNNSHVVWVKNNQNLAGQYCYSHDAGWGYMVNFCYKQIDKKAYFRKPWRPSNTYLGLKLTAQHTIIESAGLPKSSWEANYTIEAQYQYIDEMWNNEHGYVLASIMLPDSFSLGAGHWVYLYVNYNDVYVANLFPSYAILDVYAWRKDGEDRVFAPIPSSYYTKDLSDNYDGQHPTTLTFTTPLEDYANEGWEDTVYVSLRSSISNNVCDIIKYIIEHYTDLTVDSTTYTSVRAKVVGYPANFARFDKEDALELCENIAWQARMAILIRNGTVYFKYLSEVPTAVMDITPSVVEDKSLVLGFKNTDDLVTKIKATWVRDYSGRKESAHEVVYENNTDIFKTVEKDVDFYIYNIADCMKLSLYWWGYRWSNSWRTSAFDCFLEGLALEVFDIIAHKLPKLSTNTIRAMITNASHDSAEHSISIESLLASKAGDHDGAYQPVEDIQFFKGDPRFDIDDPLDISDPGNGHNEVDYDIPDYDPNDDDDEPDPPVHTIVFTQYPYYTERGVYMTLRAELHDDGGALVTENFVATLALQSSDGSDAINTSTISFVGGIWTSSLVNIIGGSGNDTGILTIGAYGKNPATATVLIYDEMSTYLTWDTYPASVTRGTNFSVALSGGTPGATVNVVVNSTDPKDKLYKNGVLITQITLDGYGAYTASDWSIRGGQGDDSGILTATDPTGVMAPTSCPQFAITGISAQSVRQTFTMTDHAVADSPRVVVTVPDWIDNNHAFTLRVEYQDSNGDVITSFNGGFQIQLEDENGEPFTWISGGPNTAAYGSLLLATATNGVWEYTLCYATKPTGAVSPAHFKAGLADGDLETDDTCPIGLPYFTLTINDPAYRGVEQNLTIQAMLPDDTVYTNYTPALTVSLSLTSEDTSDFISPTSVSSSGWVNGAKTVAVTMSGGSGTDDASITAEDSTLTDMYGSILFELKDAFSSWAAAGTLPSTPLDADYYSGKFYVLCNDRKLYRFDGGTTWTMVADMSASSLQVHALVSTSFGLFIAGRVTDAFTARIFKWDGSSLTTDYTGAVILASVVKAGKGTNGNMYLYYTWGSYGSTMLRRTSSGWTVLYNGILFDNPFASPDGWIRDDMFDGVLYSYYNYSLGETSTVDANTWLRMAVAHSRLYQYKTSTKLQYKTTKGGSMTEVALPSGYSYDYSFDSLFSAGGNLYVACKKDSTNKLVLLKYTGSVWSEDYNTDDGYGSNPQYWARSSGELLVVAGTKAYIKG